MRPADRWRQLTELGVSRAYKAFEPQTRPGRWDLVSPSKGWATLAHHSACGRLDLVVPELVQYLG